jgi:DNA-directed RNA polymerase omega subunit
MERFTIDQLLKVKSNKYEVLAIAGKRAREIAQLIREGQIQEHVKPTIRALEELMEEVDGTTNTEEDQKEQKSTKAAPDSEEISEEQEKKP